MVKEYYSKSVKYEWKRLIQDAYHRLEFDTTMRFLKKYLPKKGLILDAGGGPGRYTIGLAKRGYNVILLDLVEENIDFAKKEVKKAGVEKRVKDFIVGDITDLSMFRSNTFDAVLCLGGPLSHVKGKRNRRKAVLELRRVAKKGAPIFISVMGRYGVLSLLLSKYVVEDWAKKELRMTEHVKRLAFKGEDYRWMGKYYCHFFDPDELKSFLRECGLGVLELVGLEGLASPNEYATVKISKDKKAWKNWVDIHDKLCTNPTVVGISAHILAVCRKTS